jgi:hypothetical protein
MRQVVQLNHAVPIPVGHEVEITEFADPRPEKKRKGGTSEFGLPHISPVVVDLETGIRWMNHVHASRGNNGGYTYRSNGYPLQPMADLEVARVLRGRVTACTVVMVEGLSTQQTALEVEFAS